MEDGNEMGGQGIASEAPHLDRAPRGGLLVHEERAAGRIVFGGGTAPWLEPETLAQLAASFPLWSKAPGIYCVVMTAAPGPFCLGWNETDLARLAVEDPPRARRALADAYALAWQIDCFTKPTVPLLDGAVRGAGAGLCLYGTHAAAGEGYSFCVPGPTRGWIPDQGTARLFARMPHQLGRYLALTGQPIGRHDAYRLQLLTHCIPSAHFAPITEALCDADPVDPILDGLHEDPGDGFLFAHADAIARCFSAERLEDVLAKLEAERGAAKQLCAEAAARMRAASPLALKITWRLLRQAAALDLREQLAVDYRVTSRLVCAREFLEGAQALASGKAPLWPSRALENVSDGEVALYFAPLTDAELALPTRSALQAPAV